VNIESSTALILDETGAVSIAQLTELSGLSEAELQVLVDCGALELTEVGGEVGEGRSSFSGRCVVTARTARRLRDDFALDDTHALAVMLRFLQRIEALERELRDLRSRGF
jgi:hypothetical protein